MVLAPWASSTYQLLSDAWCEQSILPKNPMKHRFIFQIKFCCDRLTQPTALQFPLDSINPDIFSNHNKNFPYTPHPLPPPFWKTALWHVWKGRSVCLCLCLCVGWCFVIIKALINLTEIETSWPWSVITIYFQMSWMESSKFRAYLWAFIFFGHHLWS